MARLDSYSKLPSGMEEYLSYYGWHFSKKMCQWAVSMMYRKENGREKKIEPYSKEKIDEMFRQYGIRLSGDYGYDAVYVMNMCRADFLGSSIKNEADALLYVKDTLEDPDGYDGMVFTRFYADCIGKGKPIDWEDML